MTTTIATDHACFNGTDLWQNTHTFELHVTLQLRPALHALAQMASLCPQMEEKRLRDAQQKQRRKEQDLEEERRIQQHLAQQAATAVANGTATSSHWSGTIVATGGGGGGAAAAAEGNVVMGAMRVGEAQGRRGGAGHLARSVHVSAAHSDGSGGKHHSSGGQLHAEQPSDMGHPSQPIAASHQTQQAILQPLPNHASHNLPAPQPMQPAAASHQAAASDAHGPAALPALLEEVRQERARMQGDFSEHLAFLAMQRDTTKQELQALRVRPCQHLG